MLNNTFLELNEANSIEINIDQVDNNRISNALQVSTWLINKESYDLLNYSKLENISIAEQYEESNSGKIMYFKISKGKK